MPYPTNVVQAIAELAQIKRAFRLAGVPANLVTSVETRALRAPRRQTGEFPSNRETRWTLSPTHPQYGTELDCRIICSRLLGMLLQFRNPPTIDPAIVQLLEQNYLHAPIVAGMYKDALLLEELDYHAFLAEIQNPIHGHSNFHIGHHDPALIPRHVPGNIYWRTHRSNLIQGNMTLRQARIYIVRLIARYFELGELDIT
jgi:hypothetical protein